MQFDELLKNYREQIDTLDHEIVYMLSRRFELVKQIGKIKKQNKKEILQSKRWEKLMQKLLEEADNRAVNKDLIKSIWDLIHQESLKLENKI